jgi:hypothetical protein
LTGFFKSEIPCRLPNMGFPHSHRWQPACG